MAAATVGVHSGTASIDGHAYTRLMQSEYTKAALLGLWVIGVYVAVVAPEISSVLRWIGFASLVLVPAVLASKFRDDPTHTTESTQVSI